MWHHEGRRVASDLLGSLEPAEVLSEYGGEPLTFVAQDPTGELLLVHSLSASDRISRYLVSAVDERILDALKDGRLDILGALRQARCWLADIDDGGAVAGLWRVDFAALPWRVLPRPGARLTRSGAASNEEGPGTHVIQGVIHGKSIELHEEPGLADGQRVEVTLRPVTTLA